MRDVCSKLPKTSSRQPAFQAGEEIVRWQFYKPLLFMKDKFIGRDMSVSFHEQSTLSSADAVMSCPASPTDLSQVDSFDDSCSDRNSSLVDEAIQPMARKRPHNDCTQKAAGPSKSKKLKQAEEFLRIEREKLSSLRDLFMKEEPKDESRLRVIKNPYLKLEVKNQIANIVRTITIRQLDLDGQAQNQQQERSSTNQPMQPPCQQTQQSESEMYFTLP